MGTQGDLVAFNSLSWSRSDLATAVLPNVSAEKGEALELVRADGSTIPAQVVDRDDEGAQIVFVPKSLPPVGYAAVSVRQPRAQMGHDLRVRKDHIENSFFLLELDKEGSICRLLDKRFEREVIPIRQVGNYLQLFQDGPEGEAAWNVHATFEKREYAWDPGTTIEVLEKGPVRAAVRVTRQYRQSRIVQDIVLYDRLPRIAFVTQRERLSVI